MSCANCLTSATRALRLFSFKKKTLYIWDDVTGSSSLEGSEVDSEKEVVTNSGLIMDFLFLFLFLGGVVLSWSVSLGSLSCASSGFCSSWGLEGVSELGGDFGFWFLGSVFLVCLLHQSFWVWGIGASGSVFMAVFTHSFNSLLLSGGMDMGVTIAYSGAIEGS